MRTKRFRELVALYKNKQKPSSYNEEEDAANAYGDCDSEKTRKMNSVFARKNMATCDEEKNLARPHANFPTLGYISGTL